MFQLDCCLAGELGLAELLFKGLALHRMAHVAQHDPTSVDHLKIVFSPCFMVQFGHDKLIGSM